MLPPTTAHRGSLVAAHEKLRFDEQTRLNTTTMLSNTKALNNTSYPVGFQQRVRGAARNKEGILTMRRTFGSI